MIAAEFDVSDEGHSLLVKTILTFSGLVYSLVVVMIQMLDKPHSRNLSEIGDGRLYD